MQLSARMLQDCTGVNDFDYADQLTFSKGDTIDIYFITIDDQQDKTGKGFVPAGRRHIPAVGATLSVTLTDSPNKDGAITRFCTNPFPQDTSIWVLSIFASDDLKGLVNMAMTLTEGSVVTNGYLQGAFLVEGGANGGCC
jgi:hypothetical protein